MFVENHDMGRIASDPGITPEKLRTAATLMILLKGTPSIYYGQELGMRGTPRGRVQVRRARDRNARGVRMERKVEFPGEAIWYKGQKTYWTERFARDDDGVSVAEEDRDPKSLLNHYRGLLQAARRASGVPHGLAARNPEAATYSRRRKIERRAQQTADRREPVRPVRPNISFPAATS